MPTAKTGPRLRRRAGPLLRICRYARGNALRLRRSLDHEVVPVLIMLTLVLLIGVLQKIFVDVYM